MTEEPTSNGATIHGHLRKLDEDRSVWLGQHEEHYYVKFTNDGVETRIRLTPEALQALDDLYRRNYADILCAWERLEENVWKVVVEAKSDNEGSYSGAS